MRSAKKSTCSRRTSGVKPLYIFSEIQYFTSISRFHETKFWVNRFGVSYRNRDCAWVCVHGSPVDNFGSFLVCLLENQEHFRDEDVI